MPTITLAPISRLEGHGKVTIQLDEKNEVVGAHFHVVEFRGFEKFCEGRLLAEMPVITPRICGICPVSHHLAAVKACDAALGAAVPPAAQLLRELMHMGQFIHSHALHFFYLAAPDFVLGTSSDPAQRNVFGLIEKDPALVKKAIRLRQIGQHLIERIGGRPIHPVAALPGGMSRPLSHEHRHEIRQDLKEALELAQLALTVGKGVFETYAATVPKFAAITTKYLGLHKAEQLELYDGTLRVVGESGAVIADFDPQDYLAHIGEHVESFSYMKFPFLRDLGWPAGTYRVGPLARLNVAKGIGTPLANRELAQFKALVPGAPVYQTLYYHYARLIELLYAVERAQQLIDDDMIVSHEVRIPVERRAGEGVGVIEAPRGTLIHHYWCDDAGKITKANLIVATAHNNHAIDASVAAVAKQFVKGGAIVEGDLNLVEMAVRCYDPCLSCATHAAGQMPLVVTLLAADGSVLQQVERRP